MKRKKPLTLKQRFRTLIKQTTLIHTAAWLAAFVVAWVSRSWRVHCVIHPQTRQRLAQGKPVIFALWHGRMFCLLRSIDVKKTAILISGSNDGEFITQTVRPLGFRHFIRGSSKRDGAKAVRAMVHAVNHNRFNVVTTIDGPMGPRYRVKASLGRLSRQLNVPVVPVTATARPNLFWLRRSWDHFMGPAPFSRINIIMGQPVEMHSESTLDDSQQIEGTLNRSTALLDLLFGYKQYWKS